MALHFRRCVGGLRVAQQPSAFAAFAVAVRVSGVFVAALVWPWPVVAQLSDGSIAETQSIQQSTIDSGFRQLWDASDLIDTVLLELGGNGSILVAGRRSVYLLNERTGVARRLGRRGRGPGEFNRPTAIGFAGDSLPLVWAPDQRRLLMFDSSGAFVRSVELTPPPGFGSGELGELLVFGDTVVVPWAVGARPADGVRHRLVRYAAYSLQTGQSFGTVSELRAERSKVVGPLVLPVSQYEPRPLLTAAAHGVLIAGDGLEYCFRVSLGRDWSRQQARCRNGWVAPEVSREERERRVPAQSGLSDTDVRLTRLRLANQDIPERRSALAEVFGAGDCLFVRVRTKASRWDPWFEAVDPELRPEHYEWDVLRVSPEGRLTLFGSLKLSALFELKDVRAGRLYGFLRRSDGVASVVTIPAPDVSRCRS